MGDAGAMSVWKPARMLIGKREMLPWLTHIEIRAPAKRRVRPKNSSVSACHCGPVRRCCTYRLLTAAGLCP